MSWQDLENLSTHLSSADSTSVFAGLSTDRRLLPESWGGGGGKKKKKRQNQFFFFFYNVLLLSKKNMY